MQIEPPVGKSEVCYVPNHAESVTESAAEWERLKPPWLSTNARSNWNRMRGNTEEQTRGINGRDRCRIHILKSGAEEPRVERTEEIKMLIRFAAIWVRELVWSEETASEKNN
jgi:hypothetical protein